MLATLLVATLAVSTVAARRLRVCTLSRTKSELVLQGGSTARTAPGWPVPARQSML